jgi:hypothetical protein
VFARKVTMLLKPNSIAKFSRLMEQEIIPMLRKQNGFQDELTFFNPGADAVTSISLWFNAANAESYGRGTYPVVLKKLAVLIEETPEIDTCEVVNSTFHKIGAAAAARTRIQLARSDKPSLSLGSHFDLKRRNV